MYWLTRITIKHSGEKEKIMKKTIMGIAGIILAAIYTISQFYIFYDNLKESVYTIYDEEENKTKFNILSISIPLSIAGYIGYLKGLDSIKAIGKEMKKK
jgi:hypothetical protein